MIQKPNLEQLKIWKNNEVTKYILKSIADDAIETSFERIDFKNQTTEQIAHKKIYMDGFIDGINSMSNSLDNEIAFLERQKSDDEELESLKNEIDKKRSSFRTIKRFSNGEGLK